MSHLLIQSSILPHDEREQEVKEEEDGGRSPKGKDFHASRFVAQMSLSEPEPTAH